MFKNGPLYFSKSFYDSFSFSVNLTDEFYNSLINEKPSSISLKVKDNIALIINGNKSFNAVIDYESCYNHVVQGNQSDDCYSMLCVNSGNLTVKGPPSILERNSDSNPRKRYSSQISDNENPSKRQSVDGNVSVDRNTKYPNYADEQRSHIQHQRSYTKSEVFNMLKAGKSAKEVSILCGISENVVKELLIKSERIQENSNEMLRKSIQNPSLIKKPLVKVSSTPINKKPPCSVKTEKWCRTTNFDIRNDKLNGQLYDDKSYNSKFGTIRSVHGEKGRDFNNNNIFPKPSVNKSKIKQQNRPNLTPKKNEVKDTTKQVTPILPIVKNNSVIAKTSFKETPVAKKLFIKSTEVVTSYKMANEHINKVNPLKTAVYVPKKENKLSLDFSKHGTSSHYPTEPYSKTQDETITKAKSSTEPKLIPQKVEPTKFIYKVVNPETSIFQPNENPIRELINNDPDTEDFLNDACKTCERLEECQYVYKLYINKLESLKQKVPNCRTKEEWEELFNECYQLLDEEKQPFYIKLQNETAVLQEKILEISIKIGL